MRSNEICSWVFTYRNDLSSLALKLLGIVFGGVTRHGPDSPVGSELGVLEEDLGNRAALGARGTKDRDDFLSSHFAMSTCVVG